MNDQMLAVMATRARGCPPAAKALLRTLYGNPHWRNLRVSPDSAVAIGIWQHRETAKSNLQALTAKGLIIHQGQGQHVAHPDQSLRDTLLEAVA